MMVSTHAEIPVRVCIVTPSYAPDLGGLASIAKGLADGLAALGCHVVVATQVAPRISRGEIRPSAVAVHRFPNMVGGRRFGYSPRLTWWVWRHQGSFDVVHAFSYHAPVGLMSALTISRPLVFTPTFHGGGHSPLAVAIHLVYRRVSGIIFRRSRVIVCGSHAERDALVAEFPRAASRTVVIPFALEPRSAAAEPFAISETVILTAGRLDDYKRNDVLVSAMSHVDAPTRLVFVGDGPDRARLEALARDAGVQSRVDFVGYVSDDVLARWRATASAIVSLSERESFGLSLVEGAVTGAPLVLSDIPPHREVTTLIGIDAQFVPIGATPQSVATAIEQALARARSGAVTPPPSWEDRARETLGVYAVALNGSSEK